MMRPSWSSLVRRRHEDVDDAWLAVSIVVAAPLGRFSLRIKYAVKTDKQKRGPDNGRSCDRKRRGRAGARAQKAHLINDVVRCPKRPTENQFRTYNLLNDQI